MGSEDHVAVGYIIEYIDIEKDILEDIEDIDTDIIKDMDVDRDILEDSDVIINHLLSMLGPLIAMFMVVFMLSMYGLYAKKNAVREEVFDVEPPDYITIATTDEAELPSYVEAIQCKGFI